MPTINNFKESKYILVTGAAGYIGATFTYEALKKGYYVLGLDNFSNSNKKTLTLSEMLSLSILLFMK